jgi:phage FluMu gp28-like protein
MTRCPVCGLAYDDFRTGMSYHDVYHLIYTRQHKRRHGVLGYWHETKIKMFEEHVAECSFYAAQSTSSAPELRANA